MNEIIQIKCPWCSGVLSVRNQPGIESKNVTCPVCGQKSPFVKFKRIMPQAVNEEHTQYPEQPGCGGDEHTHYGTAEETEIKTPVVDEQTSLGQIVVVSTGQTCQLRPGRNVLGREADRSQADFQIPTGNYRRMSREHLVVEVRKEAGKGYVHYVSLFKERVNETFINNEPLAFGDCIVLKHGDFINLPDITLRFEIPDEERTII